MQLLLQLVAGGILSRLRLASRAFQGNSFTPSLQTICYCSRRSRCAAAAARWHDHRWVALLALAPNQAAAERGPTRAEEGRNQNQGWGSAPTTVSRWWFLVHWRGWSWRGMPGAGGTKLTPETPIPHIFQISRSHSSWQQNVDKFSFRFFLQILKLKGHHGPFLIGGN